MSGSGAVSRYDVIVAGAGIVGASVAWHIARSGMRVAIVDAIGPAAAASGAADGSVSVASKKPGPSARLASESLKHTISLAGAGSPLQGLFHSRPSYFYATCREEEEALDDLRNKLKNLAGPVRIRADGPGPSILPGIASFASRMIEISGEGHMLGYQAVGAYLRSAGERLTKYWPARIKSFSTGSPLISVYVDKAGQSELELQAPVLVVALGLGSQNLLPGLPLRARAGQLIVTDAEEKPDLPGILTAASYLVQKTSSSIYSPRPPSVIDPLRTGQYLIGSSREEHGDPMQTDFETVQRLLRSAADVWPAIRNRRVLRVFAGVRAATADGLPIFGAMPDAPGVIVATGFEGDGICLSALAGREVARLVEGKETPDAICNDLAALSPERFFELRATAGGSQ